MSKPYTIEIHQHRLAAWAASRAASVKGCRFKVRQGVEILEDSGFDAEFSVKTLPTPKLCNKKHRKWREKVIIEAESKKLNFSHGVAAKLINCYLKVRFVCAGKHKHEHVRCLHPPIDAELLKRLAEKNVDNKKKIWNKFYKQRWSKFDSAIYEEVVKEIRDSLKGRPLWTIEKHWQGYQEGSAKLG